jgi:hypothetical protein
MDDTWVQYPLPPTMMVPHRQTFHLIMRLDGTGGENHQKTYLERDVHIKRRHVILLYQT